MCQQIQPEGRFGSLSIDENNNILANFMGIFQILSASADFINEKNSFFKPKQTIYILVHYFLY